MSEQQDAAGCTAPAPQHGPTHSMPAVQAGQQVLELRVHYAEHLPRPLAGVRLEIRLDKDVHRSQPVSLDEGVAPFNAWGQLACHDGTALLHFRVMERFSSKALFWLAPVSMATRHGTLSLGQLMDAEASGGTWTHVPIELHSKRSSLSEWLQRRRPGRKQSTVQQAQLVVEARLVLRPWLEAPAAAAAAARLRIGEGAAAPAAAPAGDKTQQQRLLPEMHLGCSLQRAAHVYGHGGFMGMALSLVQDAKWSAMLQELDPKLYEDAHLLSKLSHAPGQHVSVRLKLMTLLENSPVCCAYGLIRSGCAAPVPATPMSLMHTQISEAADEQADDQNSYTDPQVVAALAAISNQPQQACDSQSPAYDPEATSAARALEATYMESDQAMLDTLGSVGQSNTWHQPLPTITEAAAPLQHSAEVACADAGATAACGLGKPEASAQAGSTAYSQAGPSSTLAAKRALARAAAVSNEHANAALPKDMGRTPSGSELLRINSSTQAFMRLNCVSMRRIVSSRLARLGSSSGSSRCGGGIGLRGVRWVDVAKLRAQAGGNSIQMLAGAHAVNKHGYRPIGLEWDIWLSPERPWDISAAKVDHGTAGQLVLQALTTGVGLKRLAKKVGDAQLKKHGISPDQWLRSFGSALNLGLHGKEDVPLQLQEDQLGFCYELAIQELVVEGLTANSASTFGVKVEVHGNAHRTPPCHLPSLAPDPHMGKLAWSPQLAAKLNSEHSTGGSGAGVWLGRKGMQLPESVSFWPLEQNLEGTELLVELLSKRNRLYGVARLPLAVLLHDADGVSVQLHASLQPPAIPGSQLLHQPGRTPSPQGHSHTSSGAAEVELQHCGNQVDGDHAPSQQQHSAREQHHGQAAMAAAFEAPVQMEPPTKTAVPAPGSRLAKHQEQADNAAADTKSRPLYHLDEGYGVWEEGPNGANAGAAAAAAAGLDTLHVNAGGIDDEADAGEVEDTATMCSDSSIGLLTGTAVVAVTLQLRRVNWLQAATEKLGLPEAAARSCMAMLAAPGGLFLDVKSAYSMPRDLELFCAALAGVGVHVKAVCSFIPKQLVFPSRGGPAPRWDTVRFFHGLNGLENACLDGNVPRGQAVLFNGASLLLGEGSSSSPVEGRRGGGGVAGPGGLAAYRLIDEVAWMRYRAVVDEFDVAGGIYVQEPDAGPASIHALVQLVNDNPAYLPLGFAYGHLGDTTLPLFELNGKGFAAQSLLEELQARRALSAKAKEAIRAGKHRSASRFVVVAYGRRLLSANRLLRWRDQVTFLYLLADFQPAAQLPRVVDEMGGIKYIFMRFWRQYDEFSPLTLLEQGFNLNETKALVRLLRNRGVLAELPAHEKAELGLWFASRALYGSATWLLQWVGARQGLHKLAKEALLCLLESCTQEEYDVVVAAVTANRPDRLWLKLCGWTYVLSWSYMARLRAVQAVHKLHPDELAYLSDGYGYKEFSRAPVDGSVASSRPTHNRSKHWLVSTWRLLRKSGCCLITVSYNYICCCATLGLWNLCCMPRLLRPYCANIWIPLIGALVLTAFVVMFDIFIISALVLLSRLARGEGLLPGCTLSEDQGDLNDYVCNGTALAVFYVNGTSVWATNGSCLTAIDINRLFPDVTPQLQPNGSACYVDDPGA